MIGHRHRHGPIREWLTRSRCQQFPISISIVHTEAIVNRRLSSITRPTIVIPRTMVNGKSRLVIPATNLPLAVPNDSFTRIDTLNPSTLTAQRFTEVPLQDLLTVVSNTSERQLSPANCANGFYALGKMLGKGRHQVTPEAKAILKKLVTSAASKAFSRNQSLKIYYGVATGRLDLMDERLPRLLKTLIDNSIRQAANSLTQLSSQQITNLMMSLAKLGKSPVSSSSSPAFPPSVLPTRSATASTLQQSAGGKRPENISLIRALAKEICERGLRGFNPRDISTMMWSLATLGDPASPHEQEVCALVARDICRRGLKDFTPQGVSNLLWSFATLEHRDDDFLEVMSNAVCSQGLSAFNEQDICNLIWSFAKLNKRDDRLANLISDEIRVRGMRGFNSQGIANIMSSYVKLGFTCGPSPGVPSSTVAGGAPIVAMDGESLFNLLAAEIHLRGLKSFSSQAIANVAWSFGTAGSRDTQLFAIISQEVLRRGVKELSSQQVSNLVLGYAKSGHKDDDLLNAVSNQVVHGSLRRFTGFTSQGISNIMWSYAKLDRFDQELIECVVDEICSRGLKDFSAQAISTTFWSIAKLGRYYHKEFLNLVLGEIRSRGLKDFDGQDISNLLWSFATYGLKDDVFMDMLGEHIEQRVMESSCQSIVNIAWSLACLDLLNSTAAKKFFGMSLPASAQPQYIDEVALQLHQCKLAWMSQGGGGQGHQQLPPLLRDLIQDGKWVDSAVNSRNSWNESSTSHLEVSSVLQDIGYGNLKNEFVTKNGISVDILLLPDKPGKVAIEVDGPFHFLLDGKTPTGATMFKRRLLQAEGYKVYSVNVMKEWRSLQSKDEQKTYLRAMLQNEPIEYVRASVSSVESQAQCK